MWSLRQWGSSGCSTQVCTGCGCSAQVTHMRGRLVLAVDNVEVLLMSRPTQRGNLNLDGTCSNAFDCRRLLHWFEDVTLAVVPDRVLVKFVLLPVSHDTHEFLKTTVQQLCSARFDQRKHPSDTFCIVQLNGPHSESGCRHVPTCVRTQARVNPSYRIPRCPSKTNHNFCSAHVILMYVRS